MDPRAGSITNDAFLAVVLNPDTSPLDPEVTDNFNCLQLTHDFCVEPSLQLTPFVEPLPIPPVAQPVKSLSPPPDPNAHQLYDQHPPVNLYEVHIVESTHQFHPDLPPSKVWGFNGEPMGETYIARYGEPFLVRFYNDLNPAGDGTGFGKPETVVHLHNAHTASESDGFPGDFFPGGFFRDNHYTMFLAGQDEREALGTLWYHDHRVDFTAQNTYKGLTGFMIFYDEFDSGDENDLNPDAYRLPSGDYDIPLQLADKKFDPVTKELFMDIFNTDGFIGDQYTVNMKIQPYFEVERRKYRFRVLNVGPSRFYNIALSNGQKMTLIANDGNLLYKPIEVDDVAIGVAERMDVVIDFSQVEPSQDVVNVYLVNTMDQISGKGPTGTILPVDQGTKLLEFRVQPGQVGDPSMIPEKTKKRRKIKKKEIVAKRKFVFDNENGIWTINSKPFDFHDISVEVKQNTAEEWTLINAADDWEHPVHIHLEEHHIIKKNGKKPPKFERGRKDVTVLGPGDKIVVRLRFRDFVGRYPMHCHNTVHEDHAMMLRWDVVAK